MTEKILENCEKYRDHFSELLEIGCKIIDIPEGAPPRLIRRDGNNDFCVICKNGKNKGLTTHLYGCLEAHRWKSSYIYYCPLGLTYIAVSVSDAGGAVTGGLVIGPIVMGDMQDVLYDLTNDDMKRDVSELRVVTTQNVRHIAELLDAVIFKISLPENDAQIDSNYSQEKLFKEIYSAKDNYDDVDTKSAEMLLQFEKDLHLAVLRGEKSSALNMINEMLAHIHVYSSLDVGAVKARLLELLVILSRATIEAGADPAETFRLSENFISQIEQYADVDQLALWISDIVRRFIVSAFDLAQIKHSDVVFKITNHIKKNCADKLSLDSLAREVFLSKSYLSSVFKKETGLSLTAYITKVRIEKSKKLLLEDNMSLSQISYLCGFKDQSYFTKVFKKETGVSPKRFRNNYFTKTS